SGVPLRATFGGSLGPLIQDLFSLLSLVDLKTRSARRHPALAAVEQIADRIAVIVLRDVSFTPRRQAADFEHDFPVTIIERGELRVGRLLVVLVDILAARGDYCLGHSGFTQTPARDIHLMHALIADVAIAGVPEPMPVVLEAVLAIRTHGSGAEKFVPVQ